MVEPSGIPFRTIPRHSKNMSAASEISAGVKGLVSSIDVKIRVISVKNDLLINTNRSIGRYSSVAEQYTVGTQSSCSLSRTSRIWQCPVSWCVSWGWHWLGLLWDQAKRPIYKRARLIPKSTLAFPIIISQTIRPVTINVWLIFKIGIYYSDRDVVTLCVSQSELHKVIQNCVDVEQSDLGSFDRFSAFSQ